MYVVCNSLHTLSQSFSCRASFIETLLLYAKYFGTRCSVVVFRDVYGRGSSEDYQFVCTLSEKEFSRLVSKYHTYNNVVAPSE